MKIHIVTINWSDVWLTGPLNLKKKKKKKILTVVSDSVADSGSD